MRFPSNLMIFLACLASLLSQGKGLTQIIPDTTLGDESSVVNSDNPNFDRIDGGAVRGSNLFHSFQEFSILNGHSVYFSNPALIQTIFSRVTGNNPSHIWGRLGVLGDANLVFMNPHGVMFGENASLDISGSFVVTTAESIRFPDGSQFSAVNPQSAPILTIDVPVPVGLLFEGDPTGKIYNQGDLAVGKHLSLISGEIISVGSLTALDGHINLDTVALSSSDLVTGDITITGSSAQVSLLGKSATITADHNLVIEDAKIGVIEDFNLTAQDTVTVRDSISNPVQIVAGEDLVIQGNQLIDIFALNHPQSGFFSGGDMVLRSANAVAGDAHYYSGGSFTIEQLDGELGGLYSPNDPVIRSQGDVSFESYEGASLHIIAGGSVTVNTIEVTSVDTEEDSINPTATPELATVTLSDDTSIEINGNSQPTIDIRAGMNPEQIGISLALIENAPDNNSVAPTRADINIGDIWITQPNGLVLLTNQYEPNLSLSVN